MQWLFLLNSHYSQEWKRIKVHNITRATAVSRSGVTVERERKQMAILFLLLSFTITAAAVGPAEGANQCPLWFKWISTSSSAGYCACDVEATRCIHCNQINQMTTLSQSCCTFHDSRENKTRVYLCYFLLPAELPLPAKVS